VELQYVVRAEADVNEMRFLMEHKRQVEKDIYESNLPDGRRARLKMKGDYVYVYY
jgi:hypothetical protein